MNYTEPVGYVYEIVNKVNGKRYIGSSVNYKSRWQCHRSSLRRGKHHSFILQKAWDKYGEESFGFNLLLVCPKKDRIFYEKRFMVLQDYNVLRTPKEKLVRGGWNHTDAAKQAISNGNKGKVRTAEQRERVSKGRLGMKYGDEFRQKCRERQIGVSFSKETRERLRESVLSAYKERTDAVREKCLLAYNEAKMGEKIYVVCSRYGISNTTFYKYCNELGFPKLKQIGGSK